MADLYTGVTIFGLFDNSTGSALFGATGTAVPTSSILIGGSDGTDIWPLSVTSNGYLNVNASIAPPTDTVATGTLTNPGDTVVVSTQGSSALMVQITGAAISAGFIQFQVSLDGTTWQAANLYPVFPDGTPSANQTNVSPSNWTLFVGGVQKFRVLASGTYAGGPSSIVLTAGTGQYSAEVVSPIAANFLATVSQGTTPWVNNLTQVAGVVLGATAVTAFGTAPAAANVAGTNASIFAGTTALTATGSSLNTNVTNTVTVTGTVTANQGTSPWVTKDAADGTPGAAAPGTAIQVAGSDGTDLRVLLTSATGQLHVITDTGSTTVVTGTVAVTQSTSPWVVAGSLTNNNAAPTTNNVGVLPALVESGTFPATTLPAYTAGDQVLLTTSQGGALRVIPVDEQDASHINYFSADQGDTQTSVANPAVKPLLSVRTNSATIEFLIRGIEMVGGGQLIRYQLLKNATLTGSTFATSNGNMQIDTAATSFTGGTVIDSGYFAAAHLIKSIMQYATAGTPGDRFTLVASAITGTIKASGSIQWSEVAAAL